MNPVEKQALQTFAIKRLNTVTWEPLFHPRTRTKLRATVSERDWPVIQKSLSDLGLHPVVSEVTEEGGRVFTVPNSAIRRLAEAGMKAAADVVGIDPPHPDPRGR